MKRSRKSVERLTSSFFLFAIRYLLFMMAGIFFLPPVFTFSEATSSLPPVFEYEDEGRRDPFISLIRKEKTEEESRVRESKKRRVITGSSEYSLIGLVWDKGEALAIIQGKNKTWIVREGDEINDFLVSAIEGERGEVVLMEKDQVIRLKIRE